MRTAASIYLPTILDVYCIPCQVSPNRLSAGLTRSGLSRVVRTVAFSPATKLLAAAGDAQIIALYDVATGEQVAALAGHQAWVLSVSWSDSGQFLLSG